MSNYDTSYLTEQLLHKKLSRTELSEFSAGIYSIGAIQAYTDKLDTLFDELLKNDNQPDSDKKPD